MSEFPIDKDGYLSFDALSLKEHIKDRLNEAGIFTDQNYEGSYVSTVIDIVAYTFNTLMFYLNRTSTESMFSDAQIYENMNRIVKMIDYKPVGRQTSTLSFNASALGTGPTQSTGLYTIPRYAFFQVNGISYSFNEDITFVKTVSAETEALEDLSDQKLLYQGSYQEYPLYTAIGQENEVVFLTPGENVIIDHFNVAVYIKPAGGSWEEWLQTPSLYLENANAKKYELRFNENKNYELKFGNNINGQRLNPNDEVAIYYIESAGENGEIGVGDLNGQTVVEFQTTQFLEILADVKEEGLTYLTDFTSLYFENDSVSTYTSEEESVNEIRQNAPSTFRSQYRLVTQADYEAYVKTNFANLIQDVKVVNNWSYLSQQMKYFHDLGLNNPSDLSRPLYNQIMFGDACNFNNVYIIMVPKVIADVKNPASVLTAAQKELITSSIRSEKTLTSEVIPTDPVYIAVDLAISSTGASTSINDISNTQLLIVQDLNSRRDAGSIKNDIKTIFTKYFNRKNVILGQTIDVSQLSTDILSVNGVKTFYTARTDGTSRVEGLSLIEWNPIYTNDISTVVKNTTLPYFKYPYLNNASNFVDKIVIQTERTIYEGIEY